LSTILSKLPPLNLPPFHYKFKKRKNGVLIFDIIRKKYVVLTPEEWTRQHVIHYFTQYCGYSPALLAVEKKFSQNISLRADIIIYSKNCIPKILVECKSPLITLQKNRHLPQMLRYNTWLNVKQIIITNGIKFMHYTF